MKKTLRLLSMLLVFAFAFTTFGPGMVQLKAASLSNEDLLIQLDQAKQELNKINKDDIPALLLPAYEKAESAIYDMEANLTPADSAYRFNPETIYDLETIPARITLVIKACQLIAYAAKVLNRKAAAAHTKVGGMVAMALAKALNPLDNDLEDVAAQIEEAMQPGNLDSFPDATPEDPATIYFVNDLDRALHAARFLNTKTPDEVVVVKKWNFDLHEFDTIELRGTKFKSEEVRNVLAAEIHEITLKRMLPQTTIEQVYKLFDEVIGACLSAMMAPDLEEADRPADITLKTQLYGEIVKANAVVVKLFFKGLFADWKAMKGLIWEARGIHLNPKATVQEVLATMQRLNEATEMTLAR